jgi:hypothetical protein
MGLSITGYVLEPVRVGVSNSPFTLTPDNLVTDPGAFDTAYPSDESEPRTEYMVQVLEESYLGSATGPNGALSLPDARFGYTRNEGVVQVVGSTLTQVAFQRFDYSGSDQRFKLLTGSTRETPGTLEADANTNRLAVTIPIIDDLANFPVRMSVGDTSSGTTFSVALVDEDVDFTTPAVGSVQLSQETGNLNWNPTDVSSFQGQAVYFQRQNYFFPEEANGNIGTVGTDTLVLNPIPTTGQLPLVSFGSRGYLTPLEVPNDGALGAPASGQFQWSLETGLVRLNAADEVTFEGQPLIYHGTLVGTFQVPTLDRGTVTAPISLGSSPDEESDTFFRISGSRQFPTVKYVDAIDPSDIGKAGEVQVERGSGNIKFSTIDQLRYGTDPIQAVFTDVEIERGITLRLFRSPVDPGNTDDSVKDVTATYTKEGDDAATLADPIIGQPVVFIPALPLDDQPLIVEVFQGTGSFTGTLERLDTNPPPGAGKGYLIDFDSQQLLYGERKVDEIIESGPSEFGAFQMPNFPVFPANFELEQEISPGSGSYTALTPGVDYLLDPEAGVVNLTETDGTLVLESSGGGILNSTDLDDSSQDFGVAGVQPGDYLIVVAGPNEGVYTIQSVVPAQITILENFPSPPEDPVTYEIRRGAETTADRYWREVPRIDPNTEVKRVVGAVPTTLTLGVDYEIQPGTGFIEFTERMLEDEEVLISYAYIDDNGNKVPVTDERGVFLVSKELTQDHPTPTSTLFYNPEGKEVATEPAPMAWRGGRPQRTGEQVTFDTVASSVTFLDDDQFTDALPHGSIVGPEENVYVDYYLHGALGGEKNLTVLNVPMASVQVTIEEEDENGDPTTSFTIEGDRTADFPDQHMLRVDGQEVYLLGAPTFDGTKTTVNLDQGLPQFFKSDFSNPTLEVTSGATPRVSTGTVPSYFVAETAAYDPIPRGGKTLYIAGDVSRVYTGGTAILFSDAGFQDYNFVEGSTYDPDTDKTRVTLGGGVLTQYGAPVALSRSVRPILPDASAQTNTSRSPVLTQNYGIFRKVDGEPGALLVEGVDYTINDAGVIVLADPLQLNESVNAFYTGYELVEGGTRHRASWNFVVVPSVANGLLNQVLKMEYTTYIPDTFFWRVETMTNFRGELAQQFADEAKSNSPSAGPILENTGGQALYEKGSPSIFFPEGRFANEDLVARPTLKFYNDAINNLEDYLQAADGRVVGDRDGRFRFDGNIDNPIRTSYDQVTNEIDDRFFLFASVWPGISSLTVKAYQPSITSRFFPTSRRTIGRVEGGIGVEPTEEGQVVYNTGRKPLSSITSPAKRFPFAQITEFAATGSTALKVDRAATGADLYFRPPFDSGYEIEIIGQDGSILDDTGLTIDSITDNSPADDDVVLSGGVAADIPAGSTLRLSANDGNYPEAYAVGITVAPVLNDGLITYVETGGLLSFIFSNDPPKPKGGDYWDVRVGTFHEGTEPFRFPALDGLTSDDDGDIQTDPILTPLSGSEIGVRQDGTLSGTGIASREVTLLAAIQADTTPTAQLTGSLDAPGTTLTLDSGTFSITPRPGDLVRILDGVNGPSNWVRVTGGTANTATLEPFFASDTSFTFIITLATSLSSGSGSSNATTFARAVGDFIADGVLPGHTLIAEAGSNALERRQIVSVDSATDVTIDQPFSTSVAGPFSFRVDDHLSTFGDVPASSQGQWLDALGDLQGLLQDEIDALEAYIATVGTVLIPSSTGTAGGNVLTDGAQDFEASQVSVGDVVWVRSGLNYGFWPVTGVTGPTTLTVDTTFSAGATTYEILRVTGTSEEGLDTVAQVLGSTETADAERAAAVALTGAVAVFNDAGAYANGLENSDLAARSAEALARETQVQTDTQNISAVLESIDRLYDVRYTWIDGRINLENGILVKQERAVEQREEGLAQIVRDLTKLLTAG